MEIKIQRVQITKMIENSEYFISCKKFKRWETSPKSRRKKESGRKDSKLRSFRCRWKFHFIHLFITITVLVFMIIEESNDILMHSTTQQTLRICLRMENKPKPNGKHFNWNKNKGNEEEEKKNAKQTNKQKKAFFNQNTHSP